MYIVATDNNNKVGLFFFLKNTMLRFIRQTIDLIPYPKYAQLIASHAPSLRQPSFIDQIRDVIAGFFVS